VLEVHSGERLSEQLQVHFVELPKLPPRGVPRSDERLLEDWGRFLTARGDQELEELAMSSPVIARAKRALDFLSARPDAQELARINYISAMREAEARGEARGRAEALLLLDTRGLAVFEEQRERIMSCRDAAQLEQWLRRALSARSIDEVLG